MSQDSSTENIVEGVKLDMALRSESGKTFVEEVIKILDSNIIKLLSSSTPDDIALRIINESRGILKMLSGIGDKVALARGLAAKKLANQALRRKEQEEG